MIRERVLCRLEDIAVGASKGWAEDPHAPYADILIVRTHEDVYAYRNRCPHTGAPMEWQADQFLDYHGRHIQCGIHAAVFRIGDGYCIAGPCASRSLERVEVAVRGEFLVTVEDVQDPGLSRSGR